jgi:N-acetylglucosaminyldiphosphoundecaprenol N-acetyl-beta-D-mannosaminyltransferase
MNILNVKFDNIAINEAVAQTVAWLKEGKRFNIFFLNADCLRISQRDNAYRDILNITPLVLPDGVALRLAGKIYGLQRVVNTNGTDFSPQLMRALAQEGYKIFFLGGQDGVAEEAARKIREQIPGIQIVGTHHGYLDNDDIVAEAINTSGADVLFVAFGAPRQEKWIFANCDKLKVKLCLGVGALLDFLSQRVKRAPKLVRALKLEWLWRVFMEPKRMFKRYFIDGLLFMIWLICKRLFPRS